MPTFVNAYIHVHTHPHAHMLPRLSLYFFVVPRASLAFAIVFEFVLAFLFCQVYQHIDADFETGLTFKEKVSALTPCAPASHHACCVSVSAVP